MPSKDNLYFIDNHVNHNIYLTTGNNPISYKDSDSAACQSLTKTRQTTFDYYD